ncbi:response regulator transcription factor [Peptacetobacter sp.]|uniref:response regulator transcription factor n=1 Tax=Peptacetobacter sp. TaxID=2991975 RepID=UPI0026226782|nr:response regulator transcription factor [Peptacetobacter sp.]
MYNICLLEDEEQLRNILSLYLSNEGFSVSSFADLNSAFDNISDNVDLYVIDIMLPDGSGFELMNKVKALNPSTPVILISARGDDIDKILGLEMGCDDYIAKPFMPRELVLRAKKLLARVPSSEKALENHIIKLGEYSIDTKKRIVFFNSEEIDLSSLEYDLLTYFVNNNSIALSRNKILKNVWGDNYFGSDRVVDNSIKRIRKKLPNINIETIYGYGYRLNK